MHLGHRLVGFEDRGDRVEARFADGARAEVDALVGADGIHSLVRRQLFGAETPRFTGCVAYRGLVPAERLRELGLEVTAQVWMGPGRHFVHYFVQRRRLVNFVAIVEQDTLDARVVDRPRRGRRRARRVRGLASAGARDPRRGRRDASSGRCSTARRSSAGRRAG